jgi:hypothetical protein
MDTVEINGEKYKKILDEGQKEGERYVMARTYSAGVFAGYLESHNDKHVVLRNARRIWRWAGAASLSQLAMQGTSDPGNCKFPCEVDRVELMECIELIDITDKAKESIAGVPVWSV